MQEHNSLATLSPKILVSLCFPVCSLLWNHHRKEKALHSEHLFLPDNYILHLLLMVKCMVALCVSLFYMT